MPNNPAYLPAVRTQYEEYPYPPRNPEDERNNLFAPALECLDALNHYCFSGKRNINNDFRALVAGGGTGDSIIFLAEQLRGTNAELVYVDISQASMQLAQARAKIRKLDNIRWVHGSLLELEKHQLGAFDYINCCGVLHHLTSPEDGLAVLAAHLKPDGAMGLMLYAQYGRYGVYAMQSLMRLFRQDDTPIQSHITNTRNMLASLNPLHPFSLAQSRFSDIKQFGDSGLYDLLLHSQDRAYSIPQLHQLVATQGFSIQKFFNTSLPEGNQAYSPGAYVASPKINELADALCDKDKQALGELLSSQIIKHSFYVTRNAPPLPALNADMIPSLPMSTPDNMYEKLATLAAQQEETISLKSNGDRITLRKTPYTEYLFKYLDGKSSVEEIISQSISHAERDKKPTTSRNVLLQEFTDIYNALNHPGNRTDWLMLRHTSTMPIKSLQQLQQDCKKRADS